MKRRFRASRRLQPHSDGQRRWDHAYQLLLQWADNGALPEAHRLRPPLLAKEATDAGCDLCTRLHATPGADADH
jgi:hypothetical protein